MARTATGDLIGLCVKAQAAGAQRSPPVHSKGAPGRFTWEKSGPCEAPVLREFWGRQNDRKQEITDFASLRKNGVDVPFLTRFGYLARDDEPTMPYHVGRLRRRNSISLQVDMWVPCRRCGPCLRHRANIWAARAAIEFAQAPRTWLATFTLSAEAQQRALMLAQAKYGQLPGLMFQERHEMLVPEFTKYLKRIREAVSAPLRFLLVVEPHPGLDEAHCVHKGLPHYHALIHESVRGSVTWEELTWAHDGPVHNEEHRTGLQWKLGHTKFELVRTVNGARYTAKYVAKDAACRIRASIKYGKRPIDIGPTEGWPV